MVDVAAGAGFGLRPAHRQMERPLLHPESGDARAQVAVGQLAAHQAHALLGGLHQVEAAATAERSGGDALSLVGEQPLGDLPAAVEPTDELLFGDTHIREEGLAERRLARDELDRAGLDARCAHVEHDERDTAVLRRGVRAHEAEHPVRLVGVAGPDLLTVDEEMVAAVFAARGQAREVGAGTRLGVALAPSRAAADDVGDPGLFLRLATELEQHRAEHPQPERPQRRTRVDALELLLEHRVLSG